MSSEADCPLLPALLTQTAKTFRVREVSADKAYLKKKNLAAIEAVGVLPHDRTGPCREALVWLGWWMFNHRDGGTRPRTYYVCPLHPTWRPEPQSQSIAHEIYLSSLRRRAIIWMLAERLNTHGDVARVLGVTRQHVSQEVQLYESHIRWRQQGASGWQEPWAKRLCAAGAIP